MDYLVNLAADPAAWIALATLTTMEVVLGVDNLIFISVLSNKLPEHLVRKHGELELWGFRVLIHQLFDVRL